MDLHEEAKIYVREKYPNSDINDKTSTAGQRLRALNYYIDIFAQHGIIEPSEADIENILRPAIAAKGKGKGKSADEKTIKRGLNRARDFYKWIQSKGVFQMTDNEENTSTEATYTVEEVQPQAPVPQNEAPKKATGRPKTGRTEKFTLYMSVDAMRDLTMLTEAYNTSITDLLNKFIDEYRASQSEQLAWLKERKQQFDALFINNEKE